MEQTVLYFDEQVAQLPTLRRCVARFLRDHGWGERQIEAAELVTSELTTNAVRHASPPYELRCRVDGHAVIEVEDHGVGDTPVAKPPDGRRPDGRGLLIVDRLTRSWEVDPTPGGKTVRAVLERMTATLAEPRS